MKSIDWYYYRTGCTACGKVDRFIGGRGLAVAEKVPASRKLQAADARGLLQEASTLVAMKGRRVEEFEVTGADGQALVQAMLGPTGNLRAPLLKLGRVLLVGYDEGVFQRYFS